MKTVVTSSEFRSLNASGKRKKIAELSKAAAQPVNGELREVEAQIQAFEAEFKIDSREMAARVNRGELQETWDICRWLLALNERDALASISARAQ